MAQRKMTGWRIFRLVLLIISIAFAFKAGLRRFQEQSLTSPQHVPVKQQENTPLKQQDSFIDGMKERQKMEEKQEKLDNKGEPGLVRLRQ